VNGFRLVVRRPCFIPLAFHEPFFAEECERLWASHLWEALNSGLKSARAPAWSASAARRATRVVATDINTNGRERPADAEQWLRRNSGAGGDIFVRGRRRFDVILCNPPYFKGTPLDRRAAVHGGENWSGRRLAAQAMITCGGRGALCVFGDAGDVTSLVRIFNRRLVDPVRRQARLIPSNCRSGSCMILLYIPGTESVACALRALAWAVLRASTVADS